MPRAGPSRSQRLASQSQPQPTQTQGYGRRQRRRHNEEEDDEDEGGDEVMGRDDDEEDGSAEVDGDLQKKVASLVRLAIFNEQRRLPLKRDEISKKVMGSQRGAFKPVFEGAQQILRATFGMELVELQTRAATQEAAMDGGKRKRGQEASPSQATGASQLMQTQAQEAMGLKRKATATGAKAYILRSALDTDLITVAAQTDRVIMSEELDIAPAPPDDEVGARSYGSIIAWNAGDALSALGILHVMLALILVNGRVISDADLRALLRRLQLREQDSVDLPAAMPHRIQPVDQYLGELLRKQYLDRVRIGQPAGKRGRSGASQATQAADDESGAYEWRWGPRAFAEVGEKAVARFIGEFMTEAREDDGESDSDEGEDTRGLVRGRRKEDAEKRLQAMLRGIERAAGGNLLDIA
ncbi:MAGE family-domain-containing protein [Vararia minispora EC-137]|uniref:MAGE family-domain-containing protein n=1 Tax=Vararia minispora EC-137 TaxID=1314806 RepID=A0ACB8QQ93_9AGAM|nr:MAGE family-domain-containing protein [Vararia minispora EC-137]